MARKGGAEGEMMGERPSKKTPHINYEASMKGTRPVKESKAQMEFKKGGAVKLAAGGVGKLRKGEMTKDGEPTKMPRGKMGRMK